MSRSGCAVLSLCLVAGTVNAAEMFPVPRELWDRPRSGRLVLNSAGVRQAVAALLEHPQARLVIHHGRTQEPLLQAEELRSWLVALSVESSRISLTSDLQPNDPLQLEVMQ
jgi:hypothetical protein